MRPAARAVALLAFATSAPLYGQVGTTALRNLERSPSVSVTVMQRSRAVTAALDVRVQVENLTESAIILKRISLIMPGEFASARSGESKTGVIAFPLTREIQLNPGTQRVFLFQVSDYRPRFLPTNVRLVSFVPGDYQLQIVVTYRIPLGVDTDSAQLVPISLEPPLSSLFWGGALGAVVLAAFVATYRWRQGERGSRRILSDAGGTALAGTVCSAVALLLLYRLEGLELPIKISVRDFFGGVVVGLFSYKLGALVYRQLSGDAKSPGIVAGPPRDGSAGS